MSIEDRVSELSERLTTLEDHVVRIMTDEQLAQIQDRHLIAVAIEARAGVAVYVRPMFDGSYEVFDRYNGGPPSAEVIAMVEKLRGHGLDITARKE